MKKPPRQRPNLRNEPCHCWRLDMPHDHKLGDHTRPGTDRDQQHADARPEAK